MLTHIRKWAMDGPGSAAPLCTGGFTNRTATGDYATGATCYGGEQPVPINGQYSLVDPMDIPFQNMTGRQVISDGGVTSDRFDSYIGNQSANARTGIYIHALGDRISHHVCTDEGRITPPTPRQRAFDIDLLVPGCDQGRTRCATSSKPEWTSASSSGRTARPRRRCPWSTTSW